MLGTGNPTPDPHRAGQSILVSVGGDELMFDCGPGATWRAVQAGIPPTEIDALFLTHHHFDHIADLAYLVLTRWDQGGGKVGELQIFGPPPTTHLCHLLFGDGGVYDLDITSRVRDPVSIDLFHSRGGSGPRPRPSPEVCDVTPGVVASGRDWVVTATAVSHSRYLRCYGYRIDSDEGSVVISGDTVPCRSVEDLAKNADLLVHMAVANPLTGRASSTPEGAAKVAARAGVGQLVLTHLEAVSLEPENEGRLREQVGGIFHGPVWLGKDGLSLLVGDETAIQTGGGTERKHA